MIWWLTPLAFSGEIEGQVFFQDLSIANVRILAVDSRLGGYETYTNTDGTYQFSALPDGPYRIVAVPPDPSLALPRIYPDATQICLGEILYAEQNPTGINIDLPMGASISGQLLYSDGSPAANLSILAEPVDDHGAEGAVPRLALTNGDGTFNILGLENSQEDSLWRCVFESDTLPTQFIGQSYDEDDALTIDVYDAPEVDLGSQTILEGVQITGQLSGNDTPIGITDVHVYSGSQVKTVQSDADGYYSVMGLPPGEAIAWASPTDHATTYSPSDDRPLIFVPTPEEGGVLDDLNIQAPAAHQFRVILKDAESDTPILGASVMLYNDSKTVGKGAPVDDNGQAEFDQLHTGFYSIQYYAENDGYRNAPYTDDSGQEILIEVSESSADPEITIWIEKTAQVSGILTDEDGNPIYGADVYATQGEETKRATSTISGEYTLYGLTEGNWQLSSQYTPYCPEDMNYVTFYYPGTPNPSALTTLSVTDSQPIALDWELPKDADWDAMSDAWEAEYGLDPQRDDSAEDPDLDGISNLEEYWLGTDPMESDSTKNTCGCRNQNALILPFLLFPLTGLRRR